MNSWEDLGTLDTKLIQFPNWITEPTDNFELNQEILHFLGTAYDINISAERIKNSITYQLLFDTRKKNFEFLEFFAARFGRLERFWLPEMKNYFTLYNAINDTDNSIDVYDTGFNKIYQGYERLFIYTSDYGYISRKITGVVDNGLYETLSLETIMDRDLTADNIIYFGRLFLMRFDIDEISVEYITDKISRVNLRFLELVSEYELL